MEIEARYIVLRLIALVTYAFSPSRASSLEMTNSNFLTPLARGHIESVLRQQRDQRGTIVDAEMVVYAAQMGVQGRLADVERGGGAPLRAGLHQRGDRLGLAGGQAQAAAEFARVSGLSPPIGVDYPNNQEVALDRAKTAARSRAAPPR